MSGRIRTIKPELLEDAITAGLSDRAFRIFIACILFADDYGNLRFEPAWLRGQIYWAQDVSVEDFHSALGELEGLVVPYVVKSQRYAAIKNWDKHQRVSHPGKPRVPSPPSGEVSDAPEPPPSRPSGESPETRVPDLRSPITDHDPEGDLPRALVREAPPVPERPEPAPLVLTCPDPPSLDEPLPEGLRARADGLAWQSGAPELDIEGSWRAYVAWCVEMVKPVNEARWSRWVADDCKRTKERRQLERTRETLRQAQPRLYSVKPVDVAPMPYHAVAKQTVAQLAPEDRRDAAREAAAQLKAVLG